MGADDAASSWDKHFFSVQGNGSGFFWGVSCLLLSFPGYGFTSTSVGE